MDEALKKAISTIAVDKGKSLNTWLVNHPDTPTPWIARIHEQFTLCTADLSQVERKKRLQHKNGAREFAKLILGSLGSKKDLQKHTQAIAADLKRYLIWIGCSNVHQLIIGGIDRRPSTLRSDCDAGYQTAIAFRQALHQTLHDHYYAKGTRLTPQEHLGALIVSLTLDGVLNLPELKMAVGEIVTRRIFVVDPHLRHVAGPIANGNAHFRRVILNDVTFGLACSLPSGKLAQITTPYLNASLQAFAKHCLPREHHRISLSGLCRAIDSYFRLQPEIPLFVVDYMKGDIVSTSLNESRYAQILGKRPLPETMPANEKPERPARIVKDFERPTVINDIKKLLALRPEKLARQETLIKIDYLRNNQPLQPVLLLLLDWVEWILTVKGDRPSYALMSLTNLSQHLLPQLKDLDATIATPDDWSDLIEAITTGLPPTHKVFDAIRVMTSYLKSISADDYEDAGKSQKSSVNARVITPAEIDNAVAILKVRLSPPKFRIAESLIRLAYALGCRRWELLGLQHRDIVGDEDPVIFIRDNAIRTTKTISSNRCNSLKLCSDQPFYTDFRQQLAAAHDPLSDHSIFQSADFDIEKDHKSLFGAINKALQTACRDPNVTFHTLRHSAVCQSLLAVFWHEMPVDYLLKYPYFIGIDDRANRIRSILVQPHLVNCFEHEAISQQVGHLSFSTTSESYFHFFDMLRHAFIQRINSAIAGYEQVKLALAASGFTRFSRAIRDHQSDIENNYLSLIINTYSGVIKCYEPEAPFADSENIPTDSDLYDSLMKTRDRILLLRSGDTPIESPFDATDVAANHEDHSHLKLLETLEDLHKSKIDRGADFLSFICKEPDHSDRRCRMMMASRAESVMAVLDSTAKAEFANRLKEALSYSAIQKHGHFRFRTPADAERVMSTLAQLLSDDPVTYSVTLERSVKINGKVKKSYSPELVLGSLRDVVKETSGSLLVCFSSKTESDIDWYRFRSLVWVCSLIFLKFGTSTQAVTASS